VFLRAWLVEPAAIDELINAERRASEFSAEAHGLREQLKAMTDGKT